jgi:hypothetical protein
MITIIQPAYLPWLGFFNRMALADVLVLLDHVRIDQNSKTKFANRNRIRTEQGASWLTVPIKTGGAAPMELNRVNLATKSWQRSHWRTIEMSYARSAHLKVYADQLAGLYEASYERLDEVNAAFFSFLTKELGLQTKRVELSSNLNLTKSKGDLILEICDLLGADGYISGPFGREYLDAGAFAANGIDLYFHDYVHPVYAQCGPDFISHLSALDLLLNCGARAAEIVTKKQELSMS